ncbi:DsrE family protein [Psychroflexus sediminis]|uniref:DsrE/DsrF-like family protein n=1 Tax=Psychroflexus sediminis TaxID=470826 RepID=A0A1G7V7R7_9FLAO|nr:DsrE family protein [Psychroflexus sediminis]SDG55806.1 DsrE/DsrF-like family protein [Psychroflexus sediminis]
MKYSIIHLTVLLLLVLGTNEMKAQDHNSDQHNYVVVSKNIKQLKPILMTAASLVEEDGENYGKFHVVFCGKTVSDMPDNADFKALLNQAEKQHVRVVACGLSLSKFSISPDQLPDTLEIVGNGILYGFQLKKKGFISLSI